MFVFTVISYSEDLNSLTHVKLCHLHVCFSEPQKPQKNQNTAKQDCKIYSCVPNETYSSETRSLPPITPVNEDPRHLGNNSGYISHRLVLESRAEISA